MKGKSNIRCLVVVIQILLCISPYLANGQSCARTDWLLSFDSEGPSRCTSGLISGLVRSERRVTDLIASLEEAECCQPTSPWTESSLQTGVADWWRAMDHDNAWALCQQGYFLSGLWRTGDNHLLHNIEEGICTKPADHPSHYGDCYNQDIGVCFNNTSLCRCRDNYYVTGLFRGGCNELHCLDQLRCCKMADRPETLDELSKAKTRVIDVTMSNLAMLAHYLGYGWCGGCRLGFVGEDFVRNGDTWFAFANYRCSGYKSNERLAISYQDWGFELKNIVYGRSVTQDLQPETVDSGSVINRSLRDVEESITRQETVTQSVTHTKTSSWRHAQELEIELNLTLANIKYKFTYENSEAQTNSSSSEVSRTFTVTSRTNVPANSTVDWRMILLKSRTTIPYTATVAVKFSADFHGFLRWGGGYNGPDPNFHIQHRGSDGRPRFPYRFGDSKTPFYTALRQESDKNQHPWMWADMKLKHGSAQDVINYLTNENHYLLTLTGQLDVVEGKNVQVVWENVQHVRKRAAKSPRVTMTSESPLNFKHLQHVARARLDDLPAPRPVPPEVKIEIKDTRFDVSILAKGD